MIVNQHVPLHRLVLSLSEALDHVSPAVAHHQLRVAYVSATMARLMGYRGDKLRDVFHAAALHDIGLIREQNRVRAVALNVLEGLGWHCEAGYQLLCDNEFFAAVAPIIRHHHAVWDHGRGAENGGEPVPPACHIIALADTVDRYIKRGVPVLHQTEEIIERIVSAGGSEFQPDCVEAFCEVAQAGAFWLDCTSPRIYAILTQEVDWPTLTINEDAVESIAHVFARVADSLSPWTATHSAGVATCAVALAERANFSPREQVIMHAAGYLHDLGKITVPSDILDKNGKPSPQEWAILKGHTYYTFRILDTIGGMPQISEWAAFHHERLDGTGYPFRHRAKDLTLGSRIMAVADTFTAITEDRPYRKGMEYAEAMAVLDKLAASGGLDGDVVTILRNDFDAINAVRKARQAEYAEKQKLLVNWVRAEAVAEGLDSLHVQI